MLAQLYMAVAKKLNDWFGENPEDCRHEWHVFSTVTSEVSLEVVCYKCMTFGSVPDPTEDEWSKAFYAPEAPYRWHDGDRVEFELPGDRETDIDRST